MKIGVEKTCLAVRFMDLVPAVPLRTLNVESFLPSYHHVGILYHIEHDGHLRRSKPNDDDDGVASQFGQPLKDLGFFVNQFAQIVKAQGAKLTERFTDHAPINYSVRIERAGEVS